MKIVLIEFIEEAELLIKNLGREAIISSQTIIVCLHPRVGAYLTKQGIPWKDTISYFGNEAQHRIIKETERFLAVLLDQVQFGDDFGVKRAYDETNIYHLRFYINHFLWIIELLCAIKEKHAVTEMHCCLPKNLEQMYSKKALIQDEERFVGFIAKEFCNLHKINFYGLKIDAKSSGLWKEKLLAPLARFIGTVIAWLNIEIFVKRGRLRNKTIVVPAISYRMDKLLQEIRKNEENVRCIMVWEGQPTLKHEIYKSYLLITHLFKRIKGQAILDTVISLDLVKYIAPKNLVDQKRVSNEFSKMIAVIEAKKEGFVYKQISFGEYLKDKILHGLQNEVLSLQHSINVLYNVFQLIQPKLLMAMYSSGIYGAMGELSHSMGFASLNISHGTHVPANNEYEKNENYRLATSVILNDYKDVAVQTPWADKFLDFYNDRRPRVHSGPLLYSVVDQQVRKELRESILKANQDWKVVVHATTHKTRGGMRLHIVETEDEYISSLVDLVHAVNALDKTYLIIRPHPACGLSEDEFRALLPKCDRLSIISEGSFSRVLSAADILMSYSSTCIEEAIQNEIPVILFDKWSRYNHFNLEETKSWNGVKKLPAYYITQSDLLAKGIQTVLRLAQQGFSQEELKEYRYPKDFRNSFREYVKQALNKSLIYSQTKGANIEYRLNHG